MEKSSADFVSLKKITLSSMEKAAYFLRVRLKIRFVSPSIQLWSVIHKKVSGFSLECIKNSPKPVSFSFQPHENCWEKAGSAGP